MYSAVESIKSACMQWPAGYLAVNLLYNRKIVILCAWYSSVPHGITWLYVRHSDLEEGGRAFNECWLAVQYTHVHLSLSKYAIALADVLASIACHKQDTAWQVLVFMQRRCRDQRAAETTVHLERLRKVSVVLTVDDLPSSFIPSFLCTHCCLPAFYQLSLTCKCNTCLHIHILIGY